ncbi:MAG: hypothetical protein IPN19_06660 [Elusimicrobia bacterium]|nr:hypothetical protein [Elusimicrobiota bacterium]
MDLYFAFDIDALKNFRHCANPTRVRFFGGQWSVLDYLQQSGLPLVDEGNLLDVDTACTLNKFAHA